MSNKRSRRGSINLSQVTSTPSKAASMSLSSSSLSMRRAYGDEPNKDERIRVNKKVKTLNPTVFGLGRVIDYIAPPIRITNDQYLPRPQHIDGNLVTIGPTDYSGWLGDGVFSQTSGVNAVTSGTGNFQRKNIIQFPILTTVQLFNYLVKARDAQRILYSSTTSTDIGQDTNNLYPVNAADKQYALFGNPNVDAELDSFKESYYIRNLGSVEVQMDVFEWAPREDIAAINTQATSAATFVQSTATGRDINPLACHYYDCLNIDQSITSAFVPTDAGSQWERRPGRYNKLLNKYFRCVNKKIVTLKSGGELKYDVVIPGFKKNFHDFVQKESVSAPAGGVITLKKVYGKFTRFLTIHYRSECSNIIDSAVTDSKIAGHFGYPPAMVAVRCTKYLQCRIYPECNRYASIRTTGKQSSGKDFDWWGPMDPNEQSVDNDPDVDETMVIDETTGNIQRGENAAKPNEQGVAFT